jgi:hypothetical protein
MNRTRQRVLDTLWICKATLDADPNKGSDLPALGRWKLRGFPFVLLRTTGPEFLVSTTHCPYGRIGGSAYHKIDIAFALELFLWKMTFKGGKSTVSLFHPGICSNTSRGFLKPWLYVLCFLLHIQTYDKI